MFKPKREGFSRREFLRMGSLFAAGAAIGVGGKELLDTVQELGEEDNNNDKPVELPKEKTIESEKVPLHHFYDSHPDFLRPVTPELGQWTTDQRKEREQTLEHGERIFRDVGVTFYLVQPGDTLSEIREKLSVYPEFSYLQDQLHKLNSFNIPDKKLQANLWIPIPLEQKDRLLSEQQFIAYAEQALDEIKKDSAYGVEIERILNKVSKRELLITIMALAKQEGGGSALGQFVLHRWESHQNAFSYSLFHVLMKGPGLKARRTLNLTEGQLYHPMNAVKLFLAFMVEKSAERNKHADRLFPVFENQKAFAIFYNGGNWENVNPQYLEHLKQYYDDIDKRVDDHGDVIVKSSGGQRA
jgi:hypothetical protein